jgi:DNA-binding transcriptional LysR family regulator
MLEGHRMVGFVSSRTGDLLPLEFTVGDAVRQVVLPARVQANNSDTSAELARLGLGLLQAPRYRFAEDLRQGTLIEVLAAWRPSPTPLSVLYPQSRQLAPRVRVFIDWVVEILGPRGGDAADAAP